MTRIQEKQQRKHKNYSARLGHTKQTEQIYI
jgi:hypothetical protein